MAKRLFAEVLWDYSDAELTRCVDRAYDGKFDSAQITPLVMAGDLPVLELFRGPTSAFKDVALCMLPQFMSAALKGREEKVMIVTATSGDTGKAALSGFQDAEHIGITVFYPYDKVSAIQRLQMVTQPGDNVRVCAIKGNFDDAQSAVKRLFHSAQAKAELGKDHIVLSSANSINIGRLVPQIVYYFAAYRQLLAAGKIKMGDEVNFCVPTGNFGNVLAGYYAKLMGLPVSYFDRNQAGDIISRVSYDIDVVTTSLSADLIQILTSVITVGGSFLMMCLISPAMVLCLCVTLPLAVLFTRYMGKKTRPLYARRSAAYGKMNGYVEEMFSGQKTILAYAYEEDVCQDFSAINHEAADAYRDADALGMITGPTINMINNLGLSLIGMVGAALYLL